MTTTRPIFTSQFQRRVALALEKGNVPTDVTAFIALYPDLEAVRNLQRSLDNAIKAFELRGIELVKERREFQLYLGGDNPRVSNQSALFSVEVVRKKEPNAQGTS